MMKLKAVQINQSMVLTLKKHKRVWEDPYSFEILSSQNEDEERFLVLRQINFKNYTAIISVRRSREKETKLYESIRAR